MSVANRKNLSYLSDPMIERMALAAATSADAGIRELLTPDEFDQFVAYRQTHIVQISLSKLAETISDTGGEQLTDSQVQGLIKVFLDAETPGQVRRAPINAVLNLGGAAVTEPIIASARRFLSDQQLAALVAVRSDQLAPTHDTIGAAPRSGFGP